MSTDVYIDRLDNNGEYVTCHGRLGYLSTLSYLRYNLLASLENINLIFPKMELITKIEIMSQFQRYDSWVKGLFEEEKEEALMMGLNYDYLSNHDLSKVLAKFPLNSKWRIRVD